MPLDNNDIKQLIAILQKGLSNEQDSEGSEQEIEIREDKKIQLKSNNTTHSRSNRNKDRVNEFDNMQEKNFHKSDTEIDKLLNKYPPSQRSRQSSMVSVTCRVCGKREKVSAALAPEGSSRYKCNTCSREPG
jgi:hypothetical protein